MVYDKKNRIIIDNLLSQSLRTGAMTMLLTIVLGIYLLRYFPETLVSFWLLIGLIINLSRYFVYRFIKKVSNPDSMYFFLELTIFIFLLFSAAFWGFTSWIFLIPDNLELALFIIFPCLGVVTGAIPAYSVRPYIWFSFSITLMSLLAIKFYLIDLWFVSVLIIINFIGLAPLSLYLGKQINKSLTLDLKNSELLSQLKIAKEKAEQANVAKSKFLASTSHDLRQPLHAQGILLEALNTRLKDSEHLDLLDKTIQSNNALSTQFNALLEISRLDAGKTKINLTHQLLSDLCQQVIDEHTILAQQKGIHLTLKSDFSVVKTDTLLLGRIIRNLIDNAIKFTTHGNVTIEQIEHGEFVELIISDTGIGIEQHLISSIFDEYFQIENKARDRSKGIGLGLALVRRMCDLLSIDISLTSIPKQGTQFKLLIPIGDKNLISVATSTEALSPNMPNLNILLLDDEQSIIDAMSIMLKDWSCHPKGFNTLSSVLKFIKAKHYRPDLIISDFRLGEDVNGLIALKKIHESLDAKVPAIIISGDTNPEIIDAIHHHNYYFLQKPVKAIQLQKVITLLLNDDAQHT